MPVSLSSFLFFVFFFFSSHLIHNTSHNTRFIGTKIIRFTTQSLHLAHHYNNTRTNVIKEQETKPQPAPSTCWRWPGPHTLVRVRQGHTDSLAVLPRPRRQGCRVCHRMHPPPSTPLQWTSRDEM